MSLISSILRTIVPCPPTFNLRPKHVVCLVRWVHRRRHCKRSRRPADRILQIKTPATKLQLRDNQRRSRARKKDLIDDLKRRVDEYERCGVQASVDMQNAARAMAFENDRLRGLLALHGISPDSLGRHVGLMYGSQRCHHCGSIVPQFRDESPGQHVQLHHDGIVKSEPSFNSHADVSSTVEDPSQTTSALEMLCDAAAIIVADVHGHGDKARAMASFGCHETANCRVKNVRVLDALDSAP
jgi:hypothetical protein